MPNKERYWKNPEYYRTKTREYNTQNADKIAENSRVWAEKNADKVHATKRRYYLKNKELIIERVALRRKVLKKKCVEYLGGACNKCNLKTDCLDIYCFHHRNPSEKSFDVNSRRTSEFGKVKTELDKCDLLCFNCHRKEHQSVAADRFAKFRRNRKIKAMAMFNNICLDCGLADDPCVYDFHHLDDSKKDFSFRDNQRWEVTVKELLKCIMLCANCHQRRHNICSC